MAISSGSMIPFGFTSEKNQSDGSTKNRPWFISLHFMKTPFKEHIQALVSNKLPEEKGDSKSAVAEFQKKKIGFP